MTLPNDKELVLLRIMTRNNTTSGMSQWIERVVVATYHTKPFACEGSWVWNFLLYDDNTYDQAIPIEWIGFSHNVGFAAVVPKPSLELDNPNG